MLMVSAGDASRQRLAANAGCLPCACRAMLGSRWRIAGRRLWSHHFANGGNPRANAAVLASCKGSVKGGVLTAVDENPGARIC